MESDKVLEILYKKYALIEFLNSDVVMPKDIIDMFSARVDALDAELKMIISLKKNSET